VDPEPILTAMREADSITELDVLQRHDQTAVAQFETSMPLLLLPIQGQYEQVINACYAERLGLALHRERLDAETLGQYLDCLEDPVPDSDEILWPDNEGFFRILGQRLSDVCTAFRGDAHATCDQDRLAG